MDDFSGDHMDSSIHWNQLRLLGLLVGAEGCFGNFTGAVELPGNGVGSRKSSGMVLWIGFDVFSVVVRHVRRCFHGILWLRDSVACHS